MNWKQACEEMSFGEYVGCGAMADEEVLAMRGGGLYAISTHAILDGDETGVKIEWDSLKEEVLQSNNWRVVKL